MHKQKIHYYKLPVELLKDNSAYYFKCGSRYPCNWNTYKEKKRLTTKQEDDLFFNGWVRPTTEKTSQKSTTAILFKAFKKICFDETISIELIGCPTLTWTTGKKITSVSL